MHAEGYIASEAFAVYYVVIGQEQQIYTRTENQTHLITRVGDVYMSQLTRLPFESSNDATYVSDMTNLF